MVSRRARVYLDLQRQRLTGTKTQSGSVNHHKEGDTRLWIVNESLKKLTQVSRA